MNKKKKLIFTIIVLIILILMIIYFCFFSKKIDVKFKDNIVIEINSEVYNTDYLEDIKRVLNLPNEVEKDIEDNNATDKIKLSINGGSFNAINGGTEAVYSEDLEDFVVSGTFNTAVNEAYLSSVAKVEESPRTVFKNCPVVCPTIDCYPLSGFYKKVIEELNKVSH